MRNVRPCKYSRPWIAPVQTHVIKALETIQIFFLWNISNPKIKHKTEA